MPELDLHFGFLVVVVDEAKATIERVGEPITVAVRTSAARMSECPFA